MHLVKFIKLCSILLIVTTISQNVNSQINSNKNKRVVTYHRIQVKDMNGQVVEVEPIEEIIKPLWASNVSQGNWSWKKKDQPYFEGPIPFILPPKENSNEPFYQHNHQPSISWLPNGDLLAIWYSTNTENGTELTVLCSRMRAMSEEWDPSSEFFKADNRNMHGSSLFTDKHGKLFHINGMCAENTTRDESKDLVLMSRMSNDNGVTWTVPILIESHYKPFNQPVSGAFVTRKGIIVQVCDICKKSGSNKSTIYLGFNEGKTWKNFGNEGNPLNCQIDTLCGNDIAGIHAGVVELKNGNLMALGRGYEINGKMPKSLSKDMGRTWSYEESIFPPIRTGQRLVLMRLMEGPILLISFTDGMKVGDKKGMTFIDFKGNELKGYGMFAALSFDEGKTWPVRKLITPGKGEYDGGGWTGIFTVTPYRAEHGGYLAATQSPDGVIHLVTSRLHYRFNLEWLKEPNNVLN